MELYTINMLNVMSGIDRRTLKSHLEKFEPDKKDNKSKYYSITKFAVAMWPYLSKKSGVGAAETNNQKPEDMTPMDRSKYYEAELKKTQLEELQGELTRTDEMLDTVSTAFKSLTLSIDTIPDRIELECGLDPAQMAVLMKLTKSIRENLYSDLLDSLEEF